MALPLREAVQKMMIAVLSSGEVLMTPIDQGHLNAFLDTVVRLFDVAARSATSDDFGGAPTRDLFAATIAIRVAMVPLDKGGACSAAGEIEKRLERVERVCFQLEEIIPQPTPEAECSAEAAASNYSDGVELPAGATVGDPKQKASLFARLMVRLAKAIIRLKGGCDA